ncbi:MAG: PAS domain S-box protein, partial [Bdellovibrionales bacterium]|nr:PAS domain S-box protein [Bdellovibrionales bacterium]
MDQVKNEQVDRLSAIVNSAVDAILTINSKGLIDSVNPATLKLFGYSEEDLVGKNISVLMPEPYAAEHDEYLANYLRTGVAKIIGRGREAVGKRKDGTIFPVYLAVSEFKHRGESYFTGIVRDISDLAQTAAELRASEKRQRLLIQNAPFCIYEIDLDGTITAMNAAGVAMMGFPSEADAIGESHLKVIPQKHHTQVQQFFHRTVNGDTLSFEYKSEVQNHVATFKACFVPVRDESKKLRHIMGITEDISAKREAENRLQLERTRLIHAEKMAALGEMAAGIAHELGTPIATIRGRMELLESQLERSTPDRASLIKVSKTIRDEADRMTKIIRGILSFSRDGSKDPIREEKLGTLLSDIFAYASERFRRHGIELIAEEIDPKLVIECRSTQIAQALVNLLNNACDAVRSLPHRWVRVDVRDLGPEIEISVTDSGTGIPESVRKRMMEPFFTTKPP